MRLPLFSILLLLFSLPSLGQDLDARSFKKGIKVIGGLGLNNQLYAGSNPVNRRPPYAFFLMGNLGVNLFGFSLPLFSDMFITTRRHERKR